MSSSAVQSMPPPLARRALLLAAGKGPFRLLYAQLERECVCLFRTGRKGKQEKPSSRGHSWPQLENFKGEEERRGSGRAQRRFFPSFFGKEREPLSFSLSFSRFNNIAIMRASSVAA